VFMCIAGKVKPSSGLSQRSSWRTIMVLTKANFGPHKHLSRHTQMSSAVLGQAISAVEVTNVSAHGFWLLLGTEELFVPFSEFPWFRDAPIGKLTQVELSSSHHLYWPALDIDLAVASIREPAKFPLVSRSGA